MTQLNPKADDRYLILAPHPDDESLAAGGLIQAAVKAGASVKIVHLTNGENNLISALFYYRKLFLKTSDFKGLGHVRQAEALRAAEILGLNGQSLRFLGYPDLGMFPMRNTSRGAQVISDLRSILNEHEPTHIVFPDSRDGHADHRAASLYLEEALLAANLPRPAFLLRYRVHGGTPNGRVLESDIVYCLTDDERKLKQRAILCYASQTAYRRRFLLSFALPSERFRMSRYQPLKRLDFANSSIQY